MGRILVVADLEDACCATPRGLELGRRLGFDVDVVAFTYTSLQPLKVDDKEKARLRKHLLADREQAVRARIDTYRHADQQVSLQVVWEKHIDRWIIRACAGGRYAGVVKTGNRTESLVHTSTDWQLLRECPAPVLLVARKKWHRTKPVLVTLDLNTQVKSKRALNDRVLGVGRALATALEVDLQIITAVEMPTLLADLDLVEPERFLREAKEQMQPQIRRLAADHDVPAADFHCKLGPVEKVIASRAAEVRAQVVVMGTVARKGVRARLLGNTAERVLQHMKTDVLAIKP